MFTLRHAGKFEEEGTLLFKFVFEISVG